MKKVLFATTALVASAGFAAADVDLSGSAEIGVVGGDFHGGETQFWSDIDVTFTLSGETDNGLTFGATIDLDEVGDDADASATSGDPIGETGSGEEHSVFLSGSFGTITMGDTDGAFDWALSEVALAGGTINDAETEHGGYSGNSGLDGTYDGQIVRYDHSVGDFSFAVSAEIDDSGAGDAVLGLGGQYSGDLGGVTLGVGLGYQTNDARDIFGISLTAAMDNGFSVGLNYSDLDGGVIRGEGRDSHMAIGVAYTMDALTVAANYGEYDGTTAAGDEDGFGILVNYDLGGGAVVQAGYGSGYDLGSSTGERWSLGVAMSF
ncbi:porin [Aliiroseovarius sp.]|uniref:porin n=1 Tax=Aliiroseovarius sp. TaxID=1872442 RepID=UPI003BAB47C1